MAVPVVGGFNYTNGYLNSAERGDPVSGSWSPAGNSLYTGLITRRFAEQRQSPVAGGLVQGGLAEARLRRGYRQLMRAQRTAHHSATLYRMAVLPLAE
jgi:hypothetical protein